MLLIHVVRERMNDTQRAAKATAGVGSAGQPMNGAAESLPAPLIPTEPLPACEHVAIMRIKPVGVQPVYDIQTESGQYLSNDVIVHNCFIQSVSDDLVNAGGIMDL